MFYQMSVIGQTYSGSTSFPGASTTYTPLASFATRSSILALEPTIPATNTGNGANPFDIALYVGDPYDFNVQAGELVWASNSAVHSLYRSITGAGSQQAGAAIDEVSYRFDAASNAHQFEIDSRVANITTIDHFITRSSFLTAPKQIVHGFVSFNTSDNGASISGSAVFIGNGYIEPGAYAWAGSFSGVVFDGLAYIASYSDLSAAFGANAALGGQHYLQFGFDEGRAISFDGLDYIATHGDLIRALGANEQAGARHYIEFGYREGRSPDSFDAAAYLSNYADLRAVFGTDVNAATHHFITYGFAEGRTDDPFV